MSLTHDLLGNPITLPKACAREQAAYFYDLGDKCAPGSEERAELYRKAAQAQQLAEAGKQLQESCDRRMGTKASPEAAEIY